MGTPRPPASPRPALFGLASNVASMLAYAPCCIGLVFSIVVAALEKQNRSVRFDAFQSLLVHGAAFALYLVLWLLGWVLAQVAAVLGFLTTMVLGIIGLAQLALMVLLMIKAYGGEEIELPVIGPLARKAAA
jgi:uncharacterized membrane protein